MDHTAAHSLLNAYSAAKIAPLDPLGADGMLAQLPEWNADADVTSMAQAIASLAPSEERVRAMSPYEAAAAMRDLGMLLGSMKRHGSEPCALVPRVTPALLALGKKTEMVPRDTVYHYGPWNPTGARQRRYTRDANEEGLIHCVRSAAPGVEAAIQVLAVARANDPRAPAFAAQCLHAARCVTAMVHSINFARHRVDVVFFAKVLRPYFESVVVDGQAYLGPAAAHLPLSIVDQLTWGSDCDDATYLMFREDTARYSVAAWRDLSRKASDEPSLVTRLIDAMNDTQGGDPMLFAAASSVHAILRVLLTFRGRHKVMVDKAYDPQVRHYAVGSGGFSADSVARILQLTRGRADALQEVAQAHYNEPLEAPLEISAQLVGRGHAA
jgi:monodechloroaminopyrrolnitrin synthase